MRNIKDSRKFQNSKMNSIIRERDWHLRRKSRISKVQGEFQKKDFKFQKSKRDFKNGRKF